MSRRWCFSGACVWDRSGGMDDLGARNWNNNFSYGSICFKVLIHATFCFSHGSKCLSPFVLEMTHILLPSLDSRKGFHLHIIYWRSANQACFLPMQAKTLSSLSLSLFIISDSYKFQTVHVFGNSDLCLNLNLTPCLVSAFEINDIFRKTPDFKEFLDTIIRYHI